MIVADAILLDRVATNSCLHPLLGSGRVGRFPIPSAEVKKRTETEATPTWSQVAPAWRNFTVLNVNTPRYQVQSSTV
jgi:hypothetical protein